MAGANAYWNAQDEKERLQLWNDFIDLSYPQLLEQTFPNTVALAKKGELILEALKKSFSPETLRNAQKMELNQSSQIPLKRKNDVSVEELEEETMPVDQSDAEEDLSDFLDDLWPLLQPKILYMIQNEIKKSQLPLTEQSPYRAPFKPPRPTGKRIL